MSRAGPQFAGQFTCSAQVANGTAPFSYSWTGFNDTITSPTTNATVSGTCNIGSAAGAFVSVTDSTGQTGFRGNSTICF